MFLDPQDPVVVAITEEATTLANGLRLLKRSESKLPDAARHLLHDLVWQILKV